ncbi:AAA family ATPase [Hazenella coriacea]|uniref:ATPase family protein associated with various cellular activities (AAA) n=1 Tax=Hazenella coriacea TaxID=1179467 RepID=A0A4R3LCK7_9BACL|nr:ATP-binding protein [Hazenella coriacea]TCS97020.1 ATPase family protein associated with various cellular activities (AAA) [Hazenella coriacea]
MRYSIEIGKIVEGALKYNQTMVLNYTKQLIQKLQEDGETRAVNKFSKLLNGKKKSTLTAMGNNKEMSVPVDSESRTTLAEVIYPDLNDVDVILSKNNVEKLESFILSYKNADKLNEMGIGVSNTLLLYGPPGCGKTKSAYLIAKELNLPLVVARLDSIISSYLGTTAKNIRTLFEFAQKTPCVLFLDEFDAIAKARDDGNELGELKRVVNSLLQNVDSMSKDSLLLAATNHENLLDSAVWRRFDYKLKIDLPDQESILKMIELFIKSGSQFTKRDKNELSIAFLGLSGSEIEEIIIKAIRNSIIFEKGFTKQSIFDEYFIFRNLTLQNANTERDLLKKKAKFLRSCDGKVFSYSIISRILGVSKTMVATLLGEENDD